VLGAEVPKPVRSLAVVRGRPTVASRDDACPLDAVAGEVHPPVGRRSHLECPRRQCLRVSGAAAGDVRGSVSDVHIVGTLRCSQLAAGRAALRVAVSAVLVSAVMPAAVVTSADSTWVIDYESIAVSPEVGVHDTASLLAFIASDHPKTITVDTDTGAVVSVTD
jgi:hypothetical protein